MERSHNAHPSSNLHDAELDAQVDVMKSHNQTEDAEVRDAKASARAILHQAIAEEPSRTSSGRARPLVWIGGIAAVAATITAIAMNVPQGEEVRVEPAEPSVTGSPTQTNSPDSPEPTSSDRPSLPQQATENLVDPFSLVPADQEILFRYAADLVDGRCANMTATFSSTVESMREMKLTPDEVLATRAQTRMATLGDLYREDLYLITKTINSAKEGTKYEFWGSYLDETERWMTGCDGTGYKRIFGSGEYKGGTVWPPMPVEESGMLSMLDSVMTDEIVQESVKRFNQCFAETFDVEDQGDSIDVASFLALEGGEVTTRDPEQIWSCYEESGLQPASRLAQAKWQAEHPDIVKKWQEDTAFYASKVDAAEEMIAAEEAKAGK